MSKNFFSQCVYSYVKGIFLEKNTKLLYLICKDYKRLCRISVKNENNKTSNNFDDLNERLCALFLHVNKKRVLYTMHNSFKMIKNYLKQNII